jgi:hypothetical protein
LYKFTDVPEEHTASIFMLKSKQNKKPARIRWQAKPGVLLAGFFSSSTMNREAVCSSEMSVNLYQTIGHYIPEDSILHSHHCENLKTKFNKFNY